MDTTATPGIDLATLPVEHRELLETLETHRRFLRHTVAGLIDDQAQLHPTVSSLCLGGLVKHVAAQERQWMRFVVEGPEVMSFTPEAIARHETEFELQPGETLESVLADYEQVAAHTVGIVAGEPDLDRSHPLPEAPWFEPGARWSVRRVLVHVIAETAQHAGHADIIRETIDGQKTMG
jgi:uncharacterized damage-inducible protein DinB